jgi:hypothetical protein
MQFKEFIFSSENSMTLDEAREKLNKKWPR